MSIGRDPWNARHAEEPPEHVGDVRAEDAAVGVKLVDDDVAEVLERARPARVMREDPGVEHVGVRHDDPAALARRAPRVGRRVAVVDDRATIGDAARRHELAERRLLVARERLRREEVDGARVRVFGERLEDGRWKQRLLPLAVGVATTKPRAADPPTPRAISNARAWWA